VSNKLIEYQIGASSIPYQLGLEQTWVIKSNIEISGATVKDLMTKGVALAEVSPADGRKKQRLLPCNTNGNTGNPSGHLIGE
jgi:hypothetical protein